MTGNDKNIERDLTPYQFFMLCLCLWALLMLAAGSFFQLSAGTQQILNYADYAVCLLFFLDFLHSLYTAPNKVRYMTSWGWIDLLSSIPITGSLRWGRAARVMRILLADLRAQVNRFSHNHPT
jgi:voltage-gated potassium channel